MPKLLSPKRFSEKQLRILAVEDQEEICLMLYEMFCKLGHICAPVSDGLEAIERLTQREFDMVITDISEPGEDRIELIKRIKADFTEVDVIAITGDQTQHHYTDIIKAGASDFITKPFSFDELEAKIKRIVRDRCLLAEIIELSMRDYITDLQNLRHFGNNLKWNSGRALQLAYD